MNKILYYCWNLFIVFFVDVLSWVLEVNYFIIKMVSDVRYYVGSIYFDNSNKKKYIRILNLERRRI